MNPTSPNSHEVVWSAEKITSFWALVSQVCSENFFSHAAGDELLRVLDRVLGKDVLEIGCGSGFLARKIGATGRNVIGADIAPPNEPGFVQLSSNELEKLGENRFDSVLAVEVFEHLLADDVTPTLKSALAVLRPGGTLIITTPDNERLSHNMCVCPDCHAVFHRWQHQQNFSREKFAQLVKSAGFSHVQFRDFNVVPRFVPGPLQGIARAMLIWAKKKSGRHVTLITLATK